MYSDRDVNVLGALAIALHDRLEPLGRHRDQRAIPDSALVHLSHCERPTIDSLCLVLGLSHSGAVRLADRLEKEGLVKRVIDDHDRRATPLRLTPSGESFAERALARRAAAIRSLMQCALSPEESAVLAKLAGKLLEAATESRADLYRICRLCDFAACDACPVAEAAAE